MSTQNDPSQVHSLLPAPHHDPVLSCGHWDLRSVLLFRLLCHRALPITASLIHLQRLLSTNTSVYGAGYPQRKEWDSVLRTEVQTKGTLILSSGKGTPKEADLPSPSSLTGPKCWVSKDLLRYHSWTIRDTLAQWHIRRETHSQTKLLTLPGRKRGGREWGSMVSFEDTPPMI